MRAALSRLAAVILVLGAGASPRAERLPLHAYTTADGLAHSTVNRIARDSRGFLWFCTAGGLSRFDGYRFTSFGAESGLPSAEINDFLETTRGSYWVATGAGLVRFDPAGSPHLFTPIESGDQDRRARTINVLREDADGVIWVGSRKGLSRVVHRPGGDTLEPVDIGLPQDFPDRREVSALIEDQERSLWIATSFVMTAPAVTSP